MPVIVEGALLALAVAAAAGPSLAPAPAVAAAAEAQAIKAQAAVAPRLTLPRKPGSIRFAVIGDSGRGHRPQYEIAAQMQAFRKEFAYDFVLMLGDNVYDSARPTSIGGSSSSRTSRCSTTA